MGDKARGRWVRVPYHSSEQYWEERYRRGGDSGDGSYGRLAIYKSQILNKFIEENEVNDVIEFGCGDGNQLSLLKCQNYLGIDVSETAIKICKSYFDSRSGWDFKLLSDYDGRQADITLSLDVIFHLTEDSVYSQHMNDLFNSSKRFVAIYSSNYDGYGLSKHVRHRQFTDWVHTNRPDFRLLDRIQNAYAYNSQDQQNTSFSDFFFFSR